MSTARTRLGPAAVAVVVLAVLGSCAATNGGSRSAGREDPVGRETADPAGSTTQDGSMDAGSMDAGSMDQHQMDQHQMAAADLAAGPLAPARHLGPQGDGGQIVTECGYSHSAPDDPIMWPGEPDMSHMHDFFGNVTTDSDSTMASLVRSDTTCQQRHDTAAYWAPQLRDHGQPVTPTGSVVYYRAAPEVDPTLLQAYPPGLEIIAGDMTATSPRSADLAGWACGVSSTHSPAPPDCPDSAPLRAVITFPDCWDGTHVDSRDHRRHMANSSGGDCPPSHPVHVPQLTFSILYPISGPGHDLTLASGSTYGIHADFVNSWDQDALVHEINSCLHRDVVCGLASNKGEEPLFSPG